MLFHIWSLLRTHLPRSLLRIKEALPWLMVLLSTWLALIVLSVKPLISINWVVFTILWKMHHFILFPARSSSWSSARVFGLLNRFLLTLHLVKETPAPIVRAYCWCLRDGRRLIKTSTPRRPGSMRSPKFQIFMIAFAMTSFTISRWWEITPINYSGKSHLSLRLYSL